MERTATTVVAVAAIVSCILKRQHLKKTASQKDSISKSQTEPDMHKKAKRIGSSCNGFLPAGFEPATIG
jgi:hypothetical protein